MSANPILLTPNEARVLGSLLEKEATTPEYYPLSLNALVNACNQRSNREPVMDLTEQDAREALNGLEEKRLAGASRSAEGRVTKYEHWLGEVFNFSRAESALICVLLLRGPQTPGELRGRTERIHRVGEIADVLTGLQKLIDREPPLVAVLPRQPGTKEYRYMHLFSGEPLEPTVSRATLEREAAASPAPESSVLAVPPPAQRLALLEEEVSRLRADLTEMQQQLAEFRKQFE